MPSRTLPPIARDVEAALREATKRLPERRRAEILAASGRASRTRPPRRAATKG